MTHQLDKVQIRISPKLREELHKLKKEKQFKTIDLLIWDMYKEYLLGGN